MSALRITGIEVQRGAKTVLDGCDLGIESGQLLGLIGPNGAGKTTLLRVAAGLLAPSEGAVELSGAPMMRLPARERARQLAYVAQGASADWPMSVRRIVALGRLPHLQPFRRPESGDAVQVERAMAQADVATLAAQPFNTLSGGEKVRTMLARALASEPSILLADEPLAALDPYHQLQVMALLRELANEGCAVVAVLHDLTLAARFCHRLVLLDHGRVVADGSAREVLSHDNLAEVYGISAEIEERGGEVSVVPLSPLARADEGAAR